MDTSPRRDHGDRAGTHRVPAGLVVRAPDHRPGPARLDGPVHHLARLQRDAPYRHAARRCWSTSAPTGCGSCRPASRRSATARSRATRPAARLAHRPRRRSPAALVGFLLNDLIETRFREVGLVAVMLVVGGGILWLADRLGSRRLLAVDLTFPRRLGSALAQALALIPGISRSGISISAGLFAGLDREAAARFSFLMATPITAAAALFETRRSSSRARPASSIQVGAPGRRHGRRVHRRASSRSPSSCASCAPDPPTSSSPTASSWPRSCSSTGSAEGRQPMEVMKQLRQRAIRDLVDQRPIRTQQELAAALRERGFRTTQATISRDVAELGLIKVDAARGPRPTPCRRGSSRPRRPARTGCGSCSPTCRSSSTKPACCS